MPDQISKRLLAILANERLAIRTANFAVLDTFAAEKSALFDALPTSQTVPADLLAIKACLAENQTLLRAAISGISEAQNRIMAMRNVRDGLSIYDQSGRIAKVQTCRPEMEKKA
jgi:hypothetical protein